MRPKRMDKRASTLPIRDTRIRLARKVRARDMAEPTRVAQMQREIENELKVTCGPVTEFVQSWD